MSKIVIKADGEHGHEITSKKAETIVATGGTVTVLATEGDRSIWGMHARVRGGNLVSGLRAASVSWTSLGSVDPEQAYLHSQVVLQASRIGRKADANSCTWFTGQPPRWVCARLDTAAINEWRQYPVNYWAASRYHNGDVSYCEAWEYAISQAIEDEKEVTA